MHKLDGVAIPMILGDWRLVIRALEDKLAASLALDLGSLDDDTAAEISEDIDRLTGLLQYLKSTFEAAYGVAYAPEPPSAPA
jgi:hypothetical protein